MRLGEAATGPDSPRPGPADLDRIDESSVRCFDPAAEEAMIAAVKAAGKAGDSLGGVAEVLAYGVPVGLGSHVQWDRKLDANLAQALMSIQAVKAVEIGEGWDNAGRRGSEAHDAILYDEADGYVRPTDRAGGIEGGISNGALVVARVAMKPLATLNRPVLQTVDVATKESTLSFRERTDTTAVPAMGVVAESMMALVLANEALRKFGGDSLAEIVRNRDGYLESLGSTPSAAIGQPGSAGRSSSATSPKRRPIPTASDAPRCDAPHPAGRDDGRRQDDDRSAAGRLARLALLRLGRRRGGRHRADRARAVRPRRRGRLPPGRGDRAGPGLRRPAAFGGLGGRWRRTQRGEPGPHHGERHGGLAAGTPRDAGRAAWATASAARSSGTTRPRPWCG